MLTGTIPGLKNKLRDKSNNIATSYIENHYQEMIAAALKMGISEDKAEDLVHDVYISLIRSEDNGDGYTIRKKENGTVITVEQFVYGRLKGYSKNIRYKNGRFNNFEIPASNNGHRQEELNSIQLAYENTSTGTDEIEESDLRISVLSQIEYLKKFTECGVNMNFVLHHLRELSYSSVDLTLFEAVKIIVRNNKQFADALSDTFKFAGRCPDQYNMMLSRI